MGFAMDRKKNKMAKQNKDKPKRRKQTMQQQS